MVPMLSGCSMQGFLEVYGYYDPKLESWNIDVGLRVPNFRF